MAEHLNTATRRAREAQARYYTLMTLTLLLERVTAPHSMAKCFLRPLSLTAPSPAYATPSISPVPASPTSLPPVVQRACQDLFLRLYYGQRAEPRDAVVYALRANGALVRTVPYRTVPLEGGGAVPRSSLLPSPRSSLYPPLPPRPP